jgi:hypothetical protein
MLLSFSVSIFLRLSWTCLTSCCVLLVLTFVLLNRCLTLCFSLFLFWGTVFPMCFILHLLTCFSNFYTINSVKSVVKISFIYCLHICLLENIHLEALRISNLIRMIDEFLRYITTLWPPLWSGGQSSCLQIQRSGFDSRHYQIFWVVGLERGPLSLLRIIEELYQGNSGSG